MISFRQAVPSDLEDLELREVFEHKDALMYGKLAIGNNCPAYSLIGHGGNVVGVVGGTFLFPGTLEAFGLFSEEVRREKVSFHKTVTEILDKSYDLFRLHRIQIVVRSDYGDGKKWAESLGFLYEGTMKRYGPTGLDYCLYGRTR